MNLKEFIRDKNVKREAGAFRIISDDKVPQNYLMFVSDGNESGRVEMPIGPWNYMETANMIAETMEFFQRKRRCQIVALACHSDKIEDLQIALSAFASEDPNAEIPKEFVDDDTD